MPHTRQVTAPRRKKTEPPDFDLFGEVPRSLNGLSLRRGTNPSPTASQAGGRSRDPTAVPNLAPPMTRKTHQPNPNVPKHDTIDHPRCERSEVHGKVRGRDRKKVEVGRGPNRQEAVRAGPNCREREHFRVLFSAAHLYIPRCVEVFVGPPRSARCLSAEPGWPCVGRQTAEGWDESYRLIPGSYGAPVGEVSSRRPALPDFWGLRQANGFACLNA